MIEPGVSVVICCYNGAARLAETIHRIAQQSIPNIIPWEFILVDNASTDNSAAVVRSVWDSYKISTPLHIVYEPKAGLSHARERGFESAKYDFVIMCDDDNWLQHDYVSLVFQIMMDKPNVAALGGIGTLAYEVAPPEWVAQSNIFAAGPQSPQTGRVFDYKLYGAGCVFRKSHYYKLKEYGFKSLLSDRKGIELSSGGDYELCYALVLAGYDLWYDERLKFIHFITKERLTWEYFIRYAKESSKCFDVLEIYKFVILHNFKSVSMIRLREFLYCSRIFFIINMKRLFRGHESTESRMLYFKYIEFKYKLRTLINEGERMITYHREVLAFRARIKMTKG